MRWHKAFTSLMALFLALSPTLAACGGPLRDAGSAPVVEEAAGGRADSKGDDEDFDPENVDLDEALAEDAREWTDAWMGEGGTGECFCLAESPDGAEGIMVVYDAKTDQYVTFAGRNVADERDGHVTLIDEESTLALTYEVVDVQGDTVTLDLGEYGTVRLAPCSIHDVIGAFFAVCVGGTDALAVAGDATGLERSLRIMTHGWADAWMGESADGAHCYYAEADKTDDALVLIARREGNEYVSFVGTSILDDQTGAITTTDDSSGVSITYKAVDATDGGITIDAGKYGKVTLGTATMDELIEAFVAVAENRTPVNVSEERSMRWHSVSS